MVKFLERLSSLVAPAYEFGVLVCELDKDDLHKLRCLEGILHTVGKKSYGNLDYVV